MGGPFLLSHILIVSCAILAQHTFLLDLEEQILQAIFTLAHM